MPPRKRKPVEYVEPRPTANVRSMPGRKVHHPERGLGTITQEKGQAGTDLVRVDFGTGHVAPDGSVGVLIFPQSLGVVL